MPLEFTTRVVSGQPEIVALAPGEPAWVHALTPRASLQDVFQGRSALLVCVAAWSGPDIPLARLALDALRDRQEAVDLGFLVFDECSTITKVLATAASESAVFGALGALSIRDGEVCRTPLWFGLRGSSIEFAREGGQSTAAIRAMAQQLK